MNLTQLANPRILDQPVYQPGKPIEKVAQDYNLDPNEVCKLASNENPWGASPNAIAAGKEAFHNVHLYPDGSGLALRQKISSHLKINSKQIILGNGSNEIIELLGHVFLNNDDEVIVGEHAFIVYKLTALLMGVHPVVTPMPNFIHDLNNIKNAITDKTKLIFLPSPNNPTGTANTPEEIIDFATSLPEHVIFCFDEAYAEYLENPPDLRPLINEGRKIIAMRTFSKIHGLAGLRIGYGYSNESIINLLQKARQPFNVNAIAQAAAIASLDDSDWVHQCRKRNQEGMRQMQNGLKELGLDFIPSQANFLMVNVGDGQKVFQALQKLGVIVRPLAKSINQYLRISIGTEKENTDALFALGQVMKEHLSF